MKSYAGIGSRKTPTLVLQQMYELASYLKDKNYLLRSGGAKGADTAFELGAGCKKQVFLAKDFIPVRAFEIAKEVHPAWGGLAPYAKRLHGRNVLQVLGENLDEPVTFVVCWTPDGIEHDNNRTITTGGTGQAISVASLMNIPVYNLYNENRLQELLEFVKEQ